MDVGQRVHYPSLGSNQYALRITYYVSCRVTSNSQLNPYRIAPGGGGAAAVWDARRRGNRVAYRPTQRQPLAALPGGGVPLAADIYLANRVGSAWCAGSHR